MRLTINIANICSACSEGIFELKTAKEQWHHLKQRYGDKDDEIWWECAENIRNLSLRGCKDVIDFTSKLRLNYQRL